MPLAKSVNTGGATIGDTVTYCLTWNNNSGTPQTFNVWDTVPSLITYMNCISACVKTGNVVSWSVVAAAPGSSGTFCFWGTVNGYPLLVEPMENAVALRRRDSASDLFLAFAIR